MGNNEQGSLLAVMRKKDVKVIKQPQWDSSV